jgi:cohesin loading factor subunit SCC2
MHSSYLAVVVSNEAAAVGKGKSSKKLSALFANPSLSSIAQATCAAVPHIASLVSRRDMSFSDDLVIKTVYLAKSPVFIREPASRRTKGREGVVGGPTTALMKSLRMEAMGCLRGVSSRHVIVC